MTEIKTVSNKAAREITLETPDCISATTLQEKIELIGEDVATTKLNAQLTIDFRSHIRSKLESMTDDEFNNTDEDILTMDFTDWKPEARVRKSTAEKAADLLGKIGNPEDLKAALAAAGIDVASLV